MELELRDSMVKRTREEEEDDDNEEEEEDDDDDGKSEASELWIAKDTEEEVFWCRETPSMFILCAHLRGCKRNSIVIINIREEGRDQTPTNEEKPIQKLVIMGEVMRKNEEEILGFRKVFKIPNGVVPDQIKAKYSEEESVLKICMPKFVKQFCGVQIEEVKEEEFGESSSHKVIKEFKVHVIDENPNTVHEIRNKYGENDDHREEEGKEETEEVKNSEVEESQEVSSKIIVIQSLEESDDNGVVGREVDEEIIGGRKEKENEDTEEEERVEEDDRIETEEPKCEIEDRDVEVKEGTDQESLQMKKTSNTFVGRVDKEEFENIKGGSNEIQEIGKEGFEEAMEPKEPLQGDETDVTEEEEQTDIEEPMLFGHVKDDETCKEGSQAKTKKGVVEAKKKVEAFEATVYEEKQDSDVSNHEVIGQRESDGGHEVEVEVDEHGVDHGLKDIQVEASEEEKANEQRDDDGVYVESSKEIEDELEDIQVEAREEDIKAKEQRDEVYVEISQEGEERRERQFKENEERKKSHGPLFVVGSAFVVSLAVFLVRHTRVEGR